MLFPSIDIKTGRTVSEKGKEVGYRYAHSSKNSRTVTKSTPPFSEPVAEVEFWRHPVAAQPTEPELRCNRQILL